MIKKTAHRLIRLALSNRFGFSLARRIVITLRWHLESILNNMYARLPADGIVQAGPFKDMRYPQLASSGSALAPKLLGSYEQEIHPALERCIQSQPDVVLNIGCGEGYYAVGCALRIPSTTVIAYDIDPEAQTKCRLMAKENALGTRLQVKGAATPDLLQTDSRVRSLLVLCDCEGAELDLLRPENFTAEVYDVLVEIHRVPGHDTGREIATRFESTHHLTHIYQTPREPRTYPFIQGWSSLEQHLALDEQRPYLMSWLHLEHKARTPAT